MSKVKSEEHFKNKYLRALADYHNLEKRIQEEREHVMKSATRGFILRILPFLDNLEQAEIFIKDGGLSMIKKQFIETLEQEGLKEIEVLGKKFDPHVAEAVDAVEGEKENIVVEVVRKGYEFKGQVIRPAQVKVTRSSESS